MGEAAQSQRGPVEKYCQSRLLYACIASPLTLKSKPYVKLTSFVVFTHP